MADNSFIKNASSTIYKSIH